MANKKQKNWYYVMVLTSEGPKFVTSLGEGKTAYWDKLKAPKEFSKEWAEDLAFGLQVNGHMAYSVCMKFALDHQPYYYERGHFEWKEDEPVEKQNEG